MGITGYHFHGGRTITFCRTTWSSPESVFLDCNLACQGRGYDMLSQYVQSILLILDAGYTEKLPQGKKVVFGACRITFRFRTCCIAVQLVNENLARNCMSLWLRAHSINPVLMQEPYLVYNLVGVLLGFRQESASVALSLCCATWRRFVFDFYGSQDVMYQKILQYT